mgnify:FL=1
MEKLYDNMSMEQLIELLKQKDAEIEVFKQEQEKQVEGKGYLLKQRKLVLKCTRQQLADKLGISLNTLTNWETGRTVPEWYRLDMVFEAYKLTDEQKLEYIYETIDKAKVKHDEKQAKKEAENNNEEEE